MKTNKRPYLAHRRHSFKLLPHYHTDYPLVLFILLIAGLFTYGWQSFVTAADGGSYQVNAIIEAQPLTQAATISSPAEGAQLSENITTISGTCPNDSYVSVERNAAYAGTAICNNGSWSLDLTLTPGKNELRAQAFNVTNQAGPVGDVRTVYYQPPQVTPSVSNDVSQPAVTTPPTSSSARTSPPAAGTAAPLVLSSSFSFMGVKVGDELSQTFTISGGRGPYAVHIEWGDGQDEIISVSQAGDFTVKHRYESDGTGTRSTFVINVTISDVDGTKALLQTMAVVTPVDDANGAIAGILGNSGRGDNGNDVRSGLSSLVWQVTAAAYTAIMVGLASFWLGQRHELALLREQYHRLHPHSK